jgi:hypothetical protein
MTDKDNRIRLDPPVVDFTVSGPTGQRHDEYPKPKTQARYDLMRTYLIGLLSNQSSNENTDGEPFEKRTGTLWYKKVAGLLELYDGTKFEDLSKHIGVTVNEETVALSTLLVSMLENLKYSAPRVIWCGRFETGQTNLPIPENYQGYAAIEKMHPLVYIDGLMIDPRDTVIQEGAPAYIKMNDNVNPRPGQRYTVILEHVTDITQEDVIGQG